MISLSALLIVGSLSVIVFSIAAIQNIGRHPSSQAANTSASADERSTQPPASFTFTGTGGACMDDSIFTYYEYYNGNRDYAPIFEMTNPITQASDLTFMSLETLIAGDSYGLGGSPRYNAPLEMFAALNTAGIDWYSAASSHALDKGAEGLVNEVNYVKTSYPDASITGAYRSAEEASVPVIREVNGVRVGLLSLTASTGSGKLDDSTKSLVDSYRSAEGGIDYPKIMDKLNPLLAQSDVQIVSVQWGNENDPAVSDEQRTLASFLTEQGVDVILGNNPGQIQPVEYVSAQNNTALVYYSLGTLLSAPDSREALIGGIASFSVNYDFQNKAVSFSNIQFIPTVMFFTPSFNEFKTVALQSYTDEMALRHYIYYQTGLDFSKAWISDYIRNILGTPEGIEIVGL